jgi:hypothetical protein
MSTLTITSPGVQINEVDLSVISRPIGATDVLVTGFAPQGPTEEIVNIGSVSEYEEVFGTPTNAAERYLYYTSRQILSQSPANLLVSRMPYGSGAGEGYTNSYSALVYPIAGEESSFSASTEFTLGEPISILLTDDQYHDIISNNISWSDVAGSSVTDYSDIGNAGLIVLNTSKTSVNDLYEGYYVAISDNTNFNPSSDFNSITGLKTVTAQSSGVQLFTEIPASRCSFTFTQAFSSFGKNSLSKVIENYPVGYEFASQSFADSLVVMVFKIKSTRYSQDTFTLDYAVSEAYTGSLNANRTQNNPYGGTPVSFFLDTVVNNKSTNIKIITNPYISSVGVWTKTETDPTKKEYGKAVPAKSVVLSNDAKFAFANGVHVSSSNDSSHDLGNIVAKLSRLLTTLSNDDTTNIDIIADAGLSTIWASAFARKNDVNFSTEDYYKFDELYNLNLNGIKYNDNVTIPDGLAYAGYEAITQQFVAFADSKKNHIFISDPLRHIFVQGENAKTSSKKSYVFSNDIYWPLNNLYNSVQSSYVATYGNWLKTTDIYTSKAVWIPASGYVTAVIAKTAQVTYPWVAPAGFNKGTLTNVLDLGVNPTQKQRDLLYKINVNPIAYFNQDGFVVYGQKTMYRKPSAFDRINVRRLFLTLEKETQRLLKYYVFEPNDFSTRSRLKGALIPIFDQAKLNDGCYDYLLVCDTTNNTPDVIDNNELKISIYIQPVRAAEFILADFVATRTGVNFSELIAGGQG